MSKEVPETNIPQLMEGQMMHAWGDGFHPADQMNREREHVSQKNALPTQKDDHHGALYFPPHEVPSGLVYSWHRGRMHNQDDDDNIEKSVEQGWEFVLYSDHPDHYKKNIEQMKYFPTRANDDRIKCRGMFLMKLSKQLYLNRLEGHRLRGEQIRTEANYLTNYFGDVPVPSYMVENGGAYQPFQTQRMKG